VVAVRRALGVVMIVTAIVLATSLDVRLDQWIAENIPNVNITAFIDNSHGVSKSLNSVRTHKLKFKPRVGTVPSQLPDLGVAPDFVGTEDWFNTAGDQPLTLAGLRGRVVLVDFWTYTCINCIRTLPYLEAWDAKYRSKGLTIVGVEAPEFPFEKDAGNVADAIKQFGIHYPVVQDNNLDTWNAYGNEYWPADYLIDAEGRVRYVAFGEGDYAKTEAAIRSLLVAAGAKGLGGGAITQGALTPSAVETPETYLGTARAMGWISGEPTSGTHTYQPPAQPLALASNTFAYGGTWTIGSQQALAGANATIDAQIQAKNVYIVLSPPAQGKGVVTVSVDGGISKSIAVTQQRLYEVASFSSDSSHMLQLRFSPGTSGYSFTFG
jgi:thiol-disulfide isomerase/thioredoxin